MSCVRSECSFEFGAIARSAVLFKALTTPSDLYPFLVRLIKRTFVVKYIYKSIIFFIIYDNTLLSLLSKQLIYPAGT